MLHHIRQYFGFEATSLCSRRQTSTAAVLLLSSGLLLGGCKKTESPQAEGEMHSGVATNKPQLLGSRVEAAVIQPSRGGLSIRVPGEVEGLRDAELGAPMGGYIELVAVKEGDKVGKGAVLARVDSQTYSTRLIRAGVEKTAAERELQRAQVLKDSIPGAEIDRAQDRLSSAEAAIKELQLAATRSVITAPFAGVIVQVEAEIGEVAAPGVPLFRLVQLQPVRVSVALSDRDMALAQVGMQARVETAAWTGVAQGKIVQLSQAANMKTRAFEALVEVSNEDGKLLPGMIAQVSLSTDGSEVEGKEGKDPGEEKLLISQDWLVTKPDGVGLFVAEEGIAHFRSVTLGSVVRRQVEVLDGVRAGDALIIVGHRSIADGDPVLIHRLGKCCEDGRAVFGK